MATDGCLCDLHLFHYFIDCHSLYLGVLGWMRCLRLLASTLVPSPPPLMASGWPFSPSGFTQTIAPKAGLASHLSNPISPVSMRWLLLVIQRLLLLRASFWLVLAPSCEVLFLVFFYFCLLFSVLFSFLLSLNLRAFQFSPRCSFVVFLLAFVSRVGVHHQGKALYTTRAWQL